MCDPSTISFASNPDTSAELGSVLDLLARALQRYRYRFASEKQLHEGIAYVLSAEGIHFEHEYPVTHACRLDFWCRERGIVIEAKVAGTLPEALHQVDRYLTLEASRAALVLSTRPWARQPGIAKDYVLRGKPVRVVHLKAQSF